MRIHDISEWQDPASTDYNVAAGYIIRTSHGLTEDRHWRDHFNRTVWANKPLGLYHYFEHDPPEDEADFFRKLVGFLAADQVHLGFWLDSEEGRGSGDIDRFRQSSRLPWCGLYSNLDGYNNHHREYLHFGLNWLALPTGTVLPAGSEMPDHILVQTATVNGVDVNETTPIQPYPAAWLTTPPPGG